MTRAAQLYYGQDLNQVDVARVLGVSRTTVSRLLSDARSTGVVTIEINQPVELLPDLSEELRTTLGLRDALVVPAEHDEELAMQAVGRAAAQLLESIIHDGDILAISWGRSLSRLADALNDIEVEGVEVVQMVGSLGEGDPRVDGPDLARRFAERLGGGYRYVHAPAVVASAAVRAELESQPQIRQTLSKVDKAAICLTSVGSMTDPHSSLHRVGYLSEPERKEHLAKGAVGHMLARIIDADGREFTEYNQRVLAVPLSSLAERPWSICLGAGDAKAAPTLAAVRAGYVNALVVDEAAAKAMLGLA